MHSHNFCKLFPSQLCLLIICCICQDYFGCKGQKPNTNQLKTEKESLCLKTQGFRQGQVLALHSSLSLFCFSLWLHSAAFLAFQLDSLHSMQSRTKKKPLFLHPLIKCQENLLLKYYNGQVDLVVQPGLVPTKRKGTRKAKQHMSSSIERIVISLGLCLENTKRCREIRTMPP